MLAAGARAAHAGMEGEEWSVGYVERNLLPDERVLYRTRLHWILFLKPVALAVLGVALTVGLAQVPEPRWLWSLGGAGLAAGRVCPPVHYAELMPPEFAVTTPRLIFKVGLIAR